MTWINRATRSYTKASNSKFPSFVPSNRTLEFRLAQKEPQPTAARFNQQQRTTTNENHISKTISINTPPDPIEQIRDTIDKPFPRNSLSRREDNSAIRCIHIDRNARILPSRSMSKSQICAQNRLQPRDLRKIDSRISNVVPSILVREEAIIFNVLNIRALIRADSILIFEDPCSSSTSNTNPHPSSSNYSIRSAFLHNLLNNLADQPQDNPSEKSPEMPYEFRALETMLGSVATTLESELAVLKTLVASLLDGLEQNIERENLKQLLLYSRRLSAFNSRALLVQRCLDEILENEQDMANAYLSEKILKNNPREYHDHEEFEQLLESFSKYVEEIVHEGTSTLTNIKSTEEIIDLILDSNRNTLLALDLKVSIGTMGLGLGALTAGLFGMNLRTHMETNAYAFFVVTGGTLVAVAISIGYGCRRLYRLRRVGLSSSTSSSSSGGSGGSSSRGGSRRTLFWRPPPSKLAPSSAPNLPSDGILDWDLPRNNSHSSSH